MSPDKSTTVPTIARKPVCRLALFLTFLACGIIGCGGESKPREAGADSGRQHEAVMSLLDSESQSQPAQTTLLSLQIQSLLSPLRDALGDSVIGDERPFLAKLDSAALVISSRLFMERDALKNVSALNKYVFDDCGMRFDHDRDNIASMLPHRVFEKKSGSCVGISLFYLLFGEKLDLPLHGVLVPGHFFIRFDNGIDRINIETMKQGKCMPDGWYRERFGGSADSGIEYRNLKVSEVVAIINYNSANVLSRSGFHVAAVTHYRAAVELLPGYAEGWGNLGLALHAAGNHSAAIESLRKARQIRPDLPNVSRNIGAVLVKKGEYAAAAREYTAALEKQPLDADLLFGLGTACYHLRDYRRARENLDAALSIRSDFADARAVRERIPAGSSAQGSPKPSM